MHVQFLSRFHRDLDKIYLSSVKESVKLVISEIKRAETISQIPNIKKLKGFKMHIALGWESIELEFIWWASGYFTERKSIVIFHNLIE